MRSLLVGKSAPCFISGLSRPRNEVGPPEFLSSFGIMCGDHACQSALPRFAATSRENLSLCDKRSGRLLGRALDHVENARLESRLPACRVDPEYEVVRAGVDDRVAVDGQAAVDAWKQDVLADILFPLPLVLPEPFTGGGVHRFDQVAGIGQVHDAAIHQGSRLLNAGAD